MPACSAEATFAQSTGIDLRGKSLEVGVLSKRGDRRD